MINKYLRGDLALPQDPIFIVGFPRSGTTLLQALMLTQKQIVSFPETHFFLSIFHLFKTDQESNLLIRIPENVYLKIHEKIGLTFTDAEKKEMKELAESGKIYVKNFFEILILKSISQNYDITQLENFRWMEKTPYHAIFLDQIFQFYPQARIIHIIRHPAAAICSMKKHFAGFFPEIGEKSYKELALNWLEFISRMERFSEKYSSEIYSLKYEDLVSDINSKMVAVFNFLNEEIETDLLTDYSLASEKIVHPWEEWKRHNRDSQIVDMNQKYRGMRNRGIKEIEKTLKTKMREYNYRNNFG